MAAAVDTSASHDVRAELERQEALDLADPLRHFLAVDDSTPGPVDTSDIRDLPSSSDYSIVPTQLESIIDQRTTIRYFCDLARRPQLLDSSGTDESEAGYWDVHLKLDMTTGCGGKIWPAAEVLGAYIAAKYSSPAAAAGAQQQEQQEDFNNHGWDWRGKTVLELGSGTGLVGFLVHAMQLQAKVYVTDQDAMLALMRDNLALNFPTTSATTACAADGRGELVVAELDWGSPIPASIPAPDVLLLADCVYLEVAFQPLIDTMQALSTSQTEILFCYQKRRKADKRFFGLLRKKFVFADVTDDDPVRTVEYRRQGTQLLRIRKK
ncbi:uncharacterized protein PAN0_004d2142 [Moesziomyces antarcticus]|uniref:Uncharacterized protein n=2 Tax=Pseudozyma antarctica TaxID=84753 RepID=A0A5C3FKY7_PSEA2|nr:uncharacterized protein PAN0_004d2142 [Moesziomyces antarcticus]GAK63933.1 conserved hypothetical protein [Moesziomyces antarcticus]SPO44856.1 uncharacterized protein PSANT_02542 [Moesziomyces antarcticus]